MRSKTTHENLNLRDSELHVHCSEIHECTKDGRLCYNGIKFRAIKRFLDFYQTKICQLNTDTINQ